MKKRLFSIILFLSLGVVGANKSDAVPLQIVLKNIKLYHGKKIKTAGRLNIQFEGDKLIVLDCSGPLDPKKSPLSIWVTYGKVKEKINQFNDKEVVVTGKIDMKNKGHFDMYAGTIDIESVEPLKDKTASKYCQ